MGTLKEGDKTPVWAGEALARAAAENPQAYSGYYRVQALKKLYQNHPEFRQALLQICEPVEKTAIILDRVSRSIQPIIKTIQQEYDAQLAAVKAIATHESQEELNRLLEDIRAAEIEADRQWQAKFADGPRPRSADDWMRLAARVGLAADFVFKGDWTPAQILPIVEGYFQHLQDQKIHTQRTDFVKSAVEAPTVHHRSHRKKGPDRVSLSEARQRIKRLQGWLDCQEKNKRRQPKDRYQLVQYAEKVGTSVEEMKAVQAWYRKYRRAGQLPANPQMITARELEQLFV